MYNPLNISLTRGDENNIINITASSISDLDRDIQIIMMANLIKTNFIKTITSKCNICGKDILFNIDDKILPKKDIISLCRNREYDMLKLYIKNCFMILYHTLDSIQLNNYQMEEIDNHLYSIVDKITL